MVTNFRKLAEICIALRYGDVSNGVSARDLHKCRRPNERTNEGGGPPRHKPRATPLLSSLPSTFTAARVVNGGIKARAWLGVVGGCPRKTGIGGPPYFSLERILSADWRN